MNVLGVYAYLCKDPTKAEPFLPIEFLRFIGGLAQNLSDSIAIALELLQSCSMPSISIWYRLYSVWKPEDLAKRLYSHTIVQYVAEWAVTFQNNDKVPMAFLQHQTGLSLASVIVYVTSVYILQQSRLATNSSTSVRFSKGK